MGQSRPGDIRPIIFTYWALYLAHWSVRENPTSPQKLYRAYCVHSSSPMLSWEFTGCYVITIYQNQIVQ